MRAFGLCVVGARGLLCCCMAVAVASIARRGAALRSASSVWGVALDVAGSVRAEVAQAVAQGPVQIRRACILCKSSLAAALSTPAHDQLPGCHRFFALLFATKTHLRRSSDVAVIDLEAYDTCAIAAIA